VIRRSRRQVGDASDEDIESPASTTSSAASQSQEKASFGFVATLEYHEHCTSATTLLARLLWSLDGGRHGEYDSLFVSFLCSFSPRSRNVTPVVIIQSNSG
jgi:hypothetical protein